MFITIAGKIFRLMHRHNNGVKAVIGRGGDTPWSDVVADVSVGANGDCEKKGAD